MKSKYLKYLALSFLGWLILTTVIYVGISFSLIEFNPFCWTEKSRVGISFVSGIAFIFTFLFAAAPCITDKDEDND